MSKLNDIVYRVIYNLEEDSINRDKISILCYLVDKEYYDRKGYTLSGTVYVRYTNVPSFEAITDSIEELLQRDVIDKVDKYERKKIFKITDYNHKMTDIKPNQVELIDRVCEEYGSLDYTDISKMVKNSEEFKNTEKYTAIFERY